jgi:hypothetical protein
VTRIVCPLDDMDGGCNAHDRAEACSEDTCVLYRQPVLIPMRQRVPRK